MTSSKMYQPKPAAPWGDYGLALVHGLVPERTDDGLRVYRAGPFVPPLSVRDHSLIVAEPTRIAIEKAGLTERTSTASRSATGRAGTKKQSCQRSVPIAADP